MRMQSESRAGWEAATKHMPTQKDMRTIWSILAIFCGVFLALSLSATVGEVLAKSSHALDWAAWTVTFSIWLSVALYARSPKYYEKYYEALRRRIEMGRKHRKSRAERIRAACVFAGVAAGLLGLVFGAPILVGMVLWPGQSWGAYLFRATPVLQVEMTVLVAGSIVRPFAMGRVFGGGKPVG